MTKSLDVFQLHNQIMEDYRLFVDSFINIKDDEIRHKVKKEMTGGKFWPEPLLQFNPAFEKGNSVQNLCSEGVLHPAIQDIFSGFSLFRHQVEAIRIGSEGRDFVVTSGTGSGKSLTFLGTIFNHLLNHGTEKGIKAVIVYPMNALINSQTEEIDKYKKKYQEVTGQEFPIDFGQYTGQEGDSERQRIRETPPDIILTNYMMLELILTVNQLSILTPCQRPKMTPLKSKKILLISPRILSLATKVAQVFFCSENGPKCSSSERKKKTWADYQQHYYSLFFNR